MTAAIPEIDAISPARFEREYVRNGTPCVLRGLLARGAAVRRWQLAGGARYLRGRLAGRTVDVLDTRKAERRPRIYEVEFGEYLDAAIEDNAQIRGLYMAQASIPPPLEPDIRAPRHVGGPKAFAPRFWLGPKGATTLLHRDREENLLCQIAGSKKLSLLSPIFDDCVYPEPLPEHGGQRASVRIQAPDLSLHPRFRTARRHLQDVVLHPGDALYLPIYWWHEAEALEANISINFWWAAPVSRWLRADHEQVFSDPERYRRERREHADDSMFADDLALARHLASEGYRILASISVADHAQRLGRTKLRDRHARATIRRAIELGERAGRLLPARSASARRQACELDVEGVIEELTALDVSETPSPRTTSTRR